MKTGTSARPAHVFKSSTSAATWLGVSTFRLNRMKPHGRSAAMKARSSSLRMEPATPVMKALVISGRLARSGSKGQEELSVLHDPTLATGGLIAVAELRGVGLGGEGRASAKGHGSALRIAARDDGRLRAEHARIFALQCPI